MGFTIAAPGRVRRSIAPARTSRRLACAMVTRLLLPFAAVEGPSIGRDPRRRRGSHAACDYARRRFVPRRIETDCRMPRAMHTDRSDEPPWEMNGRGMPVTGMRL